MRLLTWLLGGWAVLWLASGCAAKFAASRPADVGDLVVKATRLEELGRFEDAAVEWLRTTEIRSDYVPGYVNAAQAYQKIGKFGASLKVLGSAKKIGQGKPDVLLLTGYAKFGLGDYSGASAEWTVLREKEPGVAEFDHLIGQALEAKRDWKGALAAYTRVVHSDPERPDIWLAIARVHAQTGDIDKAMENLDKAVALGLDARVLEEDVRLAPVRDHPRLAALLEKRISVPVIVWPLFARIGGFPGLDVVRQEMVWETHKGLQIDTAIAPALEKKVVAKMCEASGGPCDDLVAEAARINIRPLSNAEFTALMEVVDKSLANLKVGQAAKSRLLEASAASRLEFTKQ